jgi:hypothetical protein
MAVFLPFLITMTQHPSTPTKRNNSEALAFTCDTLKMSASSHKVWFWWRDTIHFRFDACPNIVRTQTVSISQLLITFLVHMPLCLFLYTGSRVRFPAVAGNFLFTTASRTALGPTRPPVHWIPGVLSLGVKRLGPEADHWPPPSAEVKNAWSYTSTPPIRLL